VSTLLVETAPAKVNLTLRVVGRRADGYHELESLVAFASVADRLTLEPQVDTSLVLSGPFAGACGPDESNLVLKAVKALGAHNGLKAGRFTLEKELPVAAGLGGGSSDAAAALRLLARLNGIAEHELAAAALAVGADVPVCLDPRSRVMQGLGEILGPGLALPPLPALLVNPGVPLPTRDVFAALAGKRGEEMPLGEVPTTFDALIDFLAEHGNDLTEAAIACAPQVEEVLEALRGLPGVRLARMSGSGPTCFALFATAEAAATAARQLKGLQRNWWVRATHIASMRRACPP
jgi:4-diphosphocytidyl-2-C-methyl-D-erythritol kinase